MTSRGYGGPLRYVQGPGVINEIGLYIAPLSNSALIVIDAFFWDTLRPDVEKNLAAHGVKGHFLKFSGESTDKEVERAVSLGKTAGAGVVIGIGGGKALDTAKISALHIGARTVTVPTIASTDSPTSALGVIYSEDGVYDRVVRCGRNPDVVLVDSALIIKAPARFLVSGMGDALSTWYEARSNFESHSNNYIGDGYGTTAAGAAIARRCHEVLMRDGRAAYAAAIDCKLTPAVENIIEANTLLSGLGFENCGVSGAHGIHDALTVLEPTHHFFHGEKVAFGIIGLLVLENRPLDEINEAIDFCQDLKLPTMLGDLGLETVTAEDLLKVGEIAMAPASVIHSVPVKLTPRLIADCIWTASKLAETRKQSRADRVL
ncbi:iron-containing alcohol dehydrogenase [Agrobacterium vitis]|uniref:glycerol dehydrogenase n=1 Tax=Rhizobium/Agrobacterium group TaxID=227290 RepID=UPI0008DC12DA|nr:MULTISPECIES: glycerol dehydrogenase [Rhizobium/Agrobacterium group]MCF1432312.1 glycerol dehydrogenase [Allorhizobium ampelinum]MUO88152.1 iron-containing alcohol dehydrogenase [Agrobacterium vitis]MUZ50719.1 iron-containing alcohol dehydrogenase [Agrobacterium vitis]MUZ90953.1 iron-containing alcohol dehydrogenase [Agrobacterium vitis]MVA38900.1 iron-containing alcohol dehydrogenase [Agrobacterium vitis]